MIKTHEKIQFVYQFYNPQSNSNLGRHEIRFCAVSKWVRNFFDDPGLQVKSEGTIEISSLTEFWLNYNPNRRNIHSPSILAEESVTVFGNVASREQRSADFTAAVYDNPEKNYP